MQTSELDDLIAAIPGVAWAHSNQYFAEAAVLQRIGMTSVLDTDTFIQTSFAVAKPPLSGALIETFTKDNTIDEQYLVYRVPLATLRTTDAVTVVLVPDSPLFSVRNFLLSLPWISLVIFYLLAFLFPILNYLNMVATLVIVVVYAYGVTKYVLRTLGEKKLALAGRTVRYVDDHDAAVLAPEHVALLVPLAEQGVQTAVFYHDALYVRHELTTRTLLRLPLDAALVRGQLSTIVTYLLSDTLHSLRDN